MTLNFLPQSLFAFFPDHAKGARELCGWSGKRLLTRDLEHAPWRGQTRIKDQARHTSTDVRDGLFNVSFHICKRGNNSIYFSRLVKHK